MTRKFTEEHKKNMSLAKTGNKNPMWHKPHTKKWKKENSKRMSNEKNPNWKGNNASYRTIHQWVRRRKPKSMFCEKCGKITDKLDAHSINHTYERDISKWQWRCRSCNNLGVRIKRKNARRK